MQAVVYTKYGPPDVLSVEQIDKPNIKEHEVLIRIRAASVNPIDWKFRGGSIPTRLISGLIKPKLNVLGVDFSGEIEEIGKDVKRFKKGDLVYGGAFGGTYAELLAIAENSGLGLKPSNMTFEESAAVPLAALTALQALREKGEMLKGHSVLVYGASGGVGTFAVQIAVAFGAEVTAVTGTQNVELVRSLGARRVIDYTKEDFTKENQSYDILLDAVGKVSFWHSKRSLKSKGKFVTVSPKFKDLFPIVWSWAIGGAGTRKVRTLLTKLRPEDIDVLTSLIESGQIKAIIDRHYDFGRLADAHRYAELGHVQGKVVITMQGDSFVVNRSS
jgi:NADPH:quinone reductase-like Zn-dependent oxidoreductase